MNLQTSSAPFLSFHRKLFISVISLFTVLAVCFIIYQYQREKDYKIELLHATLTHYNERIYEVIKEKGVNDSLTQLLLTALIPEDIRITIISANGDIQYDSSTKDSGELENHLNRKEVEEALNQGVGFDVRRTSESTGLPYFYSAKRYDEYIVRTSLPYTVDLVNSLKAESGFIWFTVFITSFLIIVFYQFSHRLGKSVSKLREFALHADRNLPLDSSIISDFPHNELGEISQHIVKIYNRLRDTKEALYIEKEKLISHLQSSHEGLGVFTKDKKEILVNSLFIQYSNIISDHNLKTTEEVFAISELVTITDFINRVQKRSATTDEKRTNITISKNGRIFLVECIIFEDLSFEISINDITEREEQNRLKRQLTQNIAHELKTPVSSIQGYLETIVTSENIPEEKIKVFLERCYAQSNRLSRLLRDISVLTRMEEASNMIEMEQVNITAVVTTILNEVNLELETKNISVTNQLVKEIHIKGNYSLLYSIFRNLTDNAIAYAGNEVSITIRCFREDDQYYYFSFADTGNGVAPEHLNRLFERFYRIDKGRSRKVGGTGLGLAIVKNAIIIHGGNISAKNNYPKGLEFIFTLAKDISK